MNAINDTPVMEGVDKLDKPRPMKKKLQELAERLRLETYIVNPRQLANLLLGHPLAASRLRSKRSERS